MARTTSPLFPSTPNRSITAGLATPVAIPSCSCSIFIEENVQRPTPNVQRRMAEGFGRCHTSEMIRLLLGGMLLFATPALAQFSPVLLQNNSYWGDGKAEFNIYDAQIARYGVPRPCEVLHILVREPFDPKQLVKPDNPNAPDAVAVLKFNQILHVPTGLYV